ncbi:peptidylprolyl isomerase [uncultured Fusobacterium sp.]|uniref:peptidylprolyl isomerase n=1 Tax=uncultured Fusobacterium sp. TaxID=159267 RepID=UPI0025EE3498|nr:peptidylprolyl isomerase [uncultured Fusobacterium sp.]MCF2640545.1 peptidylprolyl isomerase [Fusobacterium varium]
MKMVKIVILLLIIVGGFLYHSKKGAGAKLDIKEGKIVENLVLNAKIKTSKGDINLRLLPEVAPMTVTNFVHLSRRGYYDGLKFHRVIADFMIQGGDPTGTGAGGPGYQFGDEFKQEVVFDVPGKLAMANAGPGTNGSQFFITHVPTDWLNYKHTIFGEVVAPEDQEVVNKVQQGDIIETIEITGDVEKFLEANKEMTEEMDKILAQTMPNLKK